MNSFHVLLLIYILIPTLFGLFVNCIASIDIINNDEKARSSSFIRRTDNNNNSNGINNSKNRSRKLINNENEMLKEVVTGKGNITSLPSSEMFKNSASYGFMFDLIAQKIITLTEFHFYTREADEVKYRLYTVEGDYATSKHDINSWTLIASGTTYTHGTEKPTKINRLRSITVNAGMTQGFYLTLETENLVYMATTLKAGERMKWNGDVSINTGSGVASFPLGDTFYEPRAWCGFVNYYIMDYLSLQPSISPSSIYSMTPSDYPSNNPTITTSLPTLTNSIQNYSMISNYSNFSTIPSMSPTVYPAVTPTTLSNVKKNYIITNHTFTLFGSKLDIMKSMTIEIFCNEIKISLQKYLIETYGGIHLKIHNVYFANPNPNSDQQYIFGNKNEYNEIIISIEFETFNLSDIIQLAITEMRQSILINLQRRDNTYFQKVKRIFSVITPPPLHEKEDYQIVNVNESISLLYSKSIFMDHYSEIKFEDELKSFLDKEISNKNEFSYVVLSYIKSQKFSHETSSLDLLINIQVKYLSNVTAIEEEEEEDNFDVKSTIQEILSNDNQRLYYQVKDTNLPVFGDLKSVNYYTSNATNPKNDEAIILSEGNNSNAKNDATAQEEINYDDNANETFLSSIISMKETMMDFFTTTTGYITAGAAGFTLIVFIIVMSCCCCKECCRKTFCCCCNGKEHGDRYEGLIIDTNNPHNDSPVQNKASPPDDPTAAMTAGNSTVNTARRNPNTRNTFLMENLTPSYFTSKRKIVRF